MSGIVGVHKIVIIIPPFSLLDKGGEEKRKNWNLRFSF